MANENSPARREDTINPNACHGGAALRLPCYRNARKSYILCINHHIRYLFEHIEATNPLQELVSGLAVLCCSFIP